jgi:type VI secretion system protein ImpH
MATNVRRSLPELAKNIAAEAAQYDYFQIVRILESVWGPYQENKNPLDAKVRFRPAKEINFPAADVRRVRQTRNGKLSVELNFMGLYGVDAAVPQYIVTTALHEDEAGEATKAFLDIFNHRFYVLLYQAWKKYHPAISLEDKTSKYFCYINALSGSDADISSLESLGFAGLSGQRNRSATALNGLLQDMVGAPVEIEQYISRWKTVSAKVTVGGSGDQAMLLGDNMVLGNQILDVGGSVQIILGPLSIDQAFALLPGTEKAAVMGNLVGQYLGDSIEFDTTLLVEGATGPAPALGSEGIRLGWRMWLGEATGKPYSIRISGAEYKNMSATQ